MSNIFYNAFGQMIENFTNNESSEIIREHFIGNIFGSNKSEESESDESESKMPSSDSSMPPSDSSMPPSDSSMTPSDSSMAPSDSSMPPSDSSMPPSDSSMPPSDSIEGFANESEELEETEELEEIDSENLPKMKDQDFLALDGNLVMKGVVKATDFIKEDGTKLKEVPILKNNYIMPKDVEVIDNKLKYKGDMVMNGGNNWILHTPDDKRRKLYIAPSKTPKKEDWNWSNQVVFNANGTVETKNLKTNKMEVAGPIHLYDKTTKGDDSDAYRIEKIRKSANNNELRVTLHDDANESMTIYGDSCRGGGCGKDNKARLAHRFEVNGNSWHKGKQHMNEIQVTEPKNNNNKTGWHTHFNYQNKGLNYIRGTTEVRGGLNIQREGGKSAINISNPKNGNNKSGHGTHFNYKDSGKNYIRGTTEIKGSLNIPRESGKSAINISNPKNGNNKSGHGTHFNYKDSGKNYIRGTTEMKGNVNLVDGNLTITNHGKYTKYGSLNGGWSHFVTNAPQFYMNKSLQVNGGVSSYSNKPLKMPHGADVNNTIKVGPSGWNRHLIIGGKDRNTVKGKQAHIHSTNGNLHIDSQNGRDIYLNHYTKRPVRVNGGSLCIGSVCLSDKGGRLHISKPVTINSNTDAGLRIRSNKNGHWNYMEFRDKNNTRRGWAGSQAGHVKNFRSGN